MAYPELVLIIAPDLEHFADNLLAPRSILIFWANRLAFASPPLTSKSLIFSTHMKLWQYTFRE